MWIIREIPTNCKKQIRYSWQWEWRMDYSTEVERVILKYRNENLSLGSTCKSMQIFKSGLNNILKTRVLVNFQLKNIEYVQESGWSECWTSFQRHVGKSRECVGWNKMDAVLTAFSFIVWLWAIKVEIFKGSLKMPVYQRETLADDKCL